MSQQQTENNKPMSDEAICREPASKSNISLLEMRADLKARTEAYWIEFCKEQEAAKEKMAKICAECEESLTQFRKEHPELFELSPWANSKPHDS